MFSLTIVCANIFFSRTTDSFTEFALFHNSAGVSQNGTQGANNIEMLLERQRKRRGGKKRTRTRTRRRRRRNEDKVR